MTPDNQEPTATSNSDTRISTVSIRQPTPDNQQQTTTTARYTRQPKPTPYKRQLKTDRKKIQQEQVGSNNPFPVLTTHKPPSESSIKSRCLLCHKLQTDNAIIFLSLTMQHYNRPTRPLSFKSRQRWPTMSIDKFYVEYVDCRIICPALYT
jgi:hypothetical protein